MGQRLTEAEVRQRITHRHGDKITLLRYGGSVSKISDFLCNVCGWEWSTTAASVTGLGSGCPDCGGTRRLTEVEVRQRITDRHGDKITLLRYGGSVSKISDFLCNVCGWEWSTQSNSLTSAGRGCPGCGGTRQLTEAEVRDRIVDRHGDKITMLRFGGSVQKRSDFRCNVCQWEWSTSAHHVTFGDGHGCASCAGHRPLTEAEVHQSITDVHEGRVTMLRYGGNVQKRSDFRCNVCQWEWSTSAHHVRNNHGCLRCCNRGFDIAAPGRLYLIYNLDLWAVKVGVTTAEHDTRLRKFEQHGWRHYRLPVYYEDGAEALREEQRILADWRAQGFPEALTEADMPMGGWTETAPLSALPGWEMLLDDAAS